jgi:probable phosphoglycerate mutase
MTLLAVIRHGPTAWNDDGRMQGRADVALTDDARAALAVRRAPPELDGFAWVTSPLARACATAQMLAPDRDATIEPALTEMAWGDWEGETLDALRVRLGAAFDINADRGLDFLPPGGESPRMVQQRLAPWLARVGTAGRPTVAVTHKGVIRALLGLATGWNFLGKPPARLDWTAAHLFAVARDGALAIERLNLALPAR